MPISAESFTFAKNPAVWTSLIGALILAATNFGFAKLADGQIQAINGLATVLAPIVIGLVTGLITRAQVTPNDKSDKLVKLAVKMPVGTTVGEVKAELKAVERKEAADAV